DFGQHDGRPYLAMEYLPGGTLAERLKAGRLPPRDAADVVAGVARGVAAAHAQGIVHRDLKPGNVLFDAAGTPKVADFGLAKRGGGSNLTHTNAVLGTPAYMAPEQIEEGAKLAGPAADVWALGVILYEAATGARPFDTGDNLATLRKVVEDDPVPPRTLVPAIPRDLETICLKCLAKKPADRYRSAADLAADLDLFLSGRPITARPSGILERGWQRCSRHPALSTAIAILLVVGLVVPPVLWSYQLKFDALQLARETEEARRRSEETARLAETEKTAATQEYVVRLNRAHRLIADGRPGWTWAAAADLTSAARANSPARDPVELRSAIAECEAGVDLREAGVVGPVTPETGAVLAVSPDGRWLAVADRRAGATWLATRVRLYDPATRALVHDLTFPSGLVPGRSRVSNLADGARAVAFSRDGRWLFVGARSGRVHRWDTAAPAAGVKTWDAANAEVTGFAFHPDGATVAVLHRTGEITLRAVSGDGRPLRTRGGSADGPTARGLAFVGQPTVRPGTPPAKTDPAAGLVADHGSQTGVLHPDTLAPLPSPFTTWRGRDEPPPGLGGLTYHGPTRSLYGYSGGAVYRIDPLSWSQTQEFRAPRGQADVERFAVSPDGRLLAAVTSSGHLCVWATLDGRPAVTVPLSRAYDVAFAADGRSVFVVADRGVVAFEVGGRAGYAVVLADGRPVRGFAIGGAADGLTFVTAPDTTVRMDWSEDKPAASGRMVEAELVTTDAAGHRRLSLTMPPVPSVRDACLVAVRPKGEGEVLSLRDTALGLAEPPARGVRPIRRDSPDTDVTALAYDPDGTAFWAGEGDSVVLRAADDGRPLARWTNPLNATSGRGQVYALAAGSSGAVVGCRDGQVVYLQRVTAAVGKVWRGPGGPVTAIAVTPDERLVLVGTQSGQLTAYRLPTGDTVATRTDHEDQVHAIAVSPDGRLAASAGRDRRVVLWALTGDRVDRLMTLNTAGANDPRQLAFGPDGHHLFVWHEGEFGIRIWQIDRLRDRFQATDLNW
ncbi:MAG TPA: protein kinase, partial [Gemmataceae bacterium]|nr:protein kinase [Gemmataceae bacterium]